MHLEEGHLPEGYIRHLDAKRRWSAVAASAAFLALLASLCLGAVPVPPLEALRSLLGLGIDARWDRIVRQIRLPQALAALLAGTGLSLAGAVTQSTLRNPLASPFTLGISHAAAFGAAASVFFLPRSGGTPLFFRLYGTAAIALATSLVAAAAILALSRRRDSPPEGIVLCGIALGSLFTAATMLLQYFADDVQLATMVFWTFGDLARARWPELLFMAVAVALTTVYFLGRRWDLNTLLAGEETARSLGVSVTRVRLEAMFVACLVTAIVVSLVGVIGFVGIVCPHMARRFTGDDHRFLLPGAALAGALLLLLADTAARTLLLPRVLPVAIVTAFFGAPAFIWLLGRKACR